MVDAALRLAENITLLRQRCDKPIPPTPNALSTAVVPSSDGRTLSLSDELAIVNCLSYLSTYSDHPGLVMALCIEERSDHEGLIVAIATNNDAVEDLQKGVYGIVEVLKEQSYILDTQGDYVDTLLETVLERGRERMIGRLGYPNCSTAARLGKALACAVRAVPKMRSTLQPLFELSKEFTRLSGLLEDSLTFGPGDSHVLMSILTITSRIWKNHRKDLESILHPFHPILSKDMDPNTKEVIQYRLRQLAQYKITTTHLLHYARHFPLFRSILVQGIYTPAVDLSSILTNPSIQETGILNRYIHRSKSARSPAVTAAMSALSQHNLVPLQKEIRETVTRRCTKNAYKTHAEIQLLLHYENKNVAFPPRVLKSNKDACYLCDLFIKTHGGYLIPKTHGRVYDLWMFPDVQITDIQFSKAKRKKWAQTIEQFNEAVEELLLQISRRGKRKGSDPRESAVFSLAPSTTCTQRSDVSRHSSSADQTVTRLSTKTKSPSTNEERQMWSELEEELPGESLPDALVSPLTPVSHERKHTQHDLSPSTRSSSPTPILNLRPGVPQTHIFNTNNTCIRLHTTKIHIELSRAQVDFLASSPALSGNSSNIRVDATLLDRQGSIHALEKYKEALADLGDPWSFLESKEGILFSPSGLLIRKRDDLVQIKACVT
ncbi:hypothetical protein K458DRAFT_370199 [Lentithecium fluviatile CBS 122367]|uniref:Uncharacterized protein n=1 Tax=Lentithecium fluviatile CBS 122367 TaxID=1168545 RepID=A0A6G1IVV8_9PLEO|nr:hypothetical protein K458DRAFT_370199 [Lentithecium fluviatile CBS 122367]